VYIQRTVINDLDTLTSKYTERDRERERVKEEGYSLDVHVYIQRTVINDLDALASEPGGGRVLPRSVAVGNSHKSARS